MISEKTHVKTMILIIVIIFLALVLIFTIRWQLGLPFFWKNAKIDGSEVIEFQSMGNENALTQEFCEGQGGHWESCGSACRGADPGTVCIQVCVPYCECAGSENWQCPQGFECEDLIPPDDADAVGICKKNFK